jgi:hypothetical protein
MEAIRRVTLRSALPCFVLGSLVFAPPLWSADLTIPNTFVPGTPATAGAVNDNFSATATAVNSKQNRVTGTCPVGQAVRTVNADGTVVCETSLDTRLSSVESAKAGNVFSEFFQNTVSETAAECTNWNTFRANLQPAKYTCVQLVGSSGKGRTTCDAPNVQLIATALQNGTTASIVSGSDTWNVGTCGSGIEISANTTMCVCANPGSTLRPCIGNGNPNWGGVATATCTGPSQSIQLIFR